MGKGQDQGQMLSATDSFNIMSWGIAAGAAVVRPFVNSHRGRKALGVEGLLPLIGIPLIAEEARSPEMITYYYAWLAMVVFRRVTADKSERTNYLGHAPLPRLLGLRLARRIEPFVIGASAISSRDGRPRFRGW